MTEESSINAAILSFLETDKFQPYQKAIHELCTNNTSRKKMGTNCEIYLDQAKLEIKYKQISGQISFFKAIFLCVALGCSL